MLRISKVLEVLPQALFVDGIHCPNLMHPVSGGGQADIFQGYHQYHKVALKRLRVFSSESERNVIHQASYRSCHHHVALT
jgi:hypothetical protein